VTNTKPKKAVVYCRVSSARQVKEGHGLNSQDTRCREFAKHKGYKVLESFYDEGVSGSLTEREGMLSMLDFIKAQDEPLIVIIDDISRLARGLEAHLQLRTTISGAGAKLESPSIEFGDDSDSILVENLLASVSQHQRQKNTEQVKNRMRARVLNGYWQSNPTVGYKYALVEGHGKMLIRNEPVATILQNALEGFASGLLQSQSEVRDYLMAHAAFPKKKDGTLHLQQIKDMLTRVLYAGYITIPKWDIYMQKGTA
jgi:DNA invertase Pin-like site-specific DNA recombinase